MDEHAARPVPPPAEQGWQERESSPLFRQIGPLWQKTEGDQLVLGLACTPQTLNRSGHMHGGAISAFCDTALGATLLDGMADGAGSPPRSVATIQLSVQYLAAIVPGDFVEARCRIVRQTRSLAFVEGLLDVAGKPVASSQSIFKLSRAAE